MRAWTAGMLLLVLAGCSSAPPAPEGIQDRKNRAADYLKFGRQAFQEAQYEQALSFYLIAVDLDTAVDHEAGMAAAWNSVATAQAALGRLTEAQAALVQAEGLARASGDRTLVLQVAVNVVQALLTAEDYPAARERLTALMPFPATAEGAALEHALGTLEKATEHWEASLQAFDRALALNTTLKLRQEAASNRFMKAGVLGRLDRWAEAKTELLAALALDKTMENTLGIGQDLRALGSVSLKLGAAAEAYDWYVRASRLFQAAGLAEQQKKTLDLLVPLAETLGRSEDAGRFRKALGQLAAPGS